MGQQSSAVVINGDSAGIQGKGTRQDGRRHLSERYHVQKVKLGQGTFATVWRAVDRCSGKAVALKVMEKSTLDRSNVDRSDVEREIAVMKVCNHENITRIWDTFEDMCAFYLSLEYCDCGDLSDKILERGLGIQEAEVVDWMRQVCNAMAALHTAGVCHRDVKPENFMLQAVAGASGLCLKLSDFGLASFLHREGRLQTRCGTPSFMAPEVHMTSSTAGYSFSADMWSVGVSMYVMMFGGHGPFIRADGEVDYKALFSGAVNFRERVDLLGLAKVGCGRLRFSEDARHFCKKMLQCDPSHRPTAAEAKANPWLNGPVEGRKRGPTKVLRPGPKKRNSSDAPSRWGTVLSEMATTPKSEDVALTEDLGALAVRTASKVLENDRDDIGSLAIETCTEVVTVTPVKNRVCYSAAPVPTRFRRTEKSARWHGVFKERDWDRSDAEASSAVVLPELRGLKNAGGVSGPLTPSTAASDAADTGRGESLNAQITDRLGPHKCRMSRRLSPSRGESTTDDAGMESDNSSTTDGAWPKSSSFAETADASIEQRVAQEHESEQTKVKAPENDWNPHDCRLWLEDSIEEHAVREYEWQEWLNQVDTQEPIYMQEEFPLPVPDKLAELQPEQARNLSRSSEGLQVKPKPEQGPEILCSCAEEPTTPASNQELLYIRGKTSEQSKRYALQACASSRNRSRETREPEPESKQVSRPLQEDDCGKGELEAEPQQQQRPLQQQELEQEPQAQQHQQSKDPIEEAESGQLLDAATCNAKQDVAHSQQSRAESELDEKQQQQQQQQQKQSSIEQLPSTLEAGHTNELTRLRDQMHRHMQQQVDAVQSKVRSDLEREVRDLIRGLSAEDQLTANKKQINACIQEQLGACLQEQMSQLQEQQAQLQAQRQDLEQREAALSSAREEPAQSATTHDGKNCCRRLLRLAFPRKATASLASG